MFKQQVRLMRQAAELSGNPMVRAMAREFLPGVPTVPESRLQTRLAPPTPFNRTITAHRRFAFRTLKLSDVQFVKRAFGVTVNDVVMALCASVLRTYLGDRDELPGDPLVAMVPVSVRSGGDSDVFSNQVSGVTCSLHTDLDDPVERLTAIHESMAAAKELQSAIPAGVLTDMSQFTPPILAAQAARLASRMQLGNRMRLFNVVISNVPGPRQPLYLAGGVVKHYYPVSTVADGIGLNMTVQSYLDNLDFGLIACRELVPDLWELCDLLPAALDELMAPAQELAGKSATGRRTAE